MKRLTPLLILCLLLCGCWDRREISDLGLAVGFAIDYTELEGGETGVKFTTQVANPSATAGSQGGMTGMGGTSGTGGSGGSRAFWTVSETGKTIRDAIAKMSYRVPKQLFFGHSRLCIFGENAARGGVVPFFDRLLRSRESRENNFLAVSKGDPSRILEQESTIFPAASLALNDIFRDKNGWQGIMAVNFADFDYRLSTGVTCPVMPVVEIVPQSSLSSEARRAGVNRDTIAITGLAAFDQGGRLVDYYNERETMGLLWVLNKARRQSLTIPYAVNGREEPVTLRQTQAKSKIDVSIGEDGMPAFEIKTHVTFDVLEHFGTSQGLSDISVISDMETLAASQVITEIEAAVEKSQQVKTDVFGFGEETRRQHRREWPQYKDRWKDIFPFVKVTVECEAHIHDRNLTVDTPGSRKEGAGQ